MLAHHAPSNSALYVHILQMLNFRPCTKAGVCETFRVCLSVRPSKCCPVSLLHLSHLTTVKFTGNSFEHPAE